MSYQSRLRNLFHASDLDGTLAAVGVVVSVALLGLAFVASQPLVLVVPVSTGVGCAFYLAVQNRRVSAVRVPTLPGSVAGYLPSVVVVGLAGFVGLVWVAGSRTLPAYLLGGAVGGLILLQILLIRDEWLEPGHVLFQVLLAAIVVRFAGLLSTPGFVGVDIWTHLRTFVAGIVESGSLSAIAESKYVMAPLYHAFASIATLVFGSMRPGVYLTLGLVLPLSILFVYGAGRLLVPVRWALLAAALYAFADEFVLWSMHLIPNSLGLVFFLVVLYAVTRILVAGVERWVVATLLGFSLAVVFTHQVSTVILLTLLFVATGVTLGSDVARGWPFSSVLSRKTLALGGVFSVTSFVTMLSWANTPHTGDSIFLWRVLDVAVHIITEESGFLELVGDGGSPAASGGTLLDTLVPYIELVGFGLLLAGTVVGGLVLLRRERSVAANVTFLLAGAVMFLATFGLSMFGIRVFLPGRWLAFLYAVMAIVAAAGLQDLFGSASHRAILAVVLVLAVCYPTSMLVAKRATYDSPAFPDQYDRFSYTEAEIAGAETIGEVYPATATRAIHTDHPYQTIFEPLGGYAVADTLPIRDGRAVSPFPTVYRDYQSTGPVKFTVPGERSGTLYRHTAAPATVCPAERNVVYANDQVRLCLPADAGAGGGA